MLATLTLTTVQLYFLLGTAWGAGYNTSSMDRFEVVNFLRTIFLLAQYEFY